jgi:phage shock protein E
MRPSVLSRAAFLPAVLLGTGLVLGSAGCSSGSSSASGQSPAASPSAPASVTAGTSNLDAAGFAELVKAPGAVVLDVRTPEEFSQGHLPDAKNMDVENPKIADEFEKLDKSGTYAVYCRTGNRSKAAQELMLSLGFTKVSNLTGGITAWKVAGHEVVTGS